MKIAQILDLGKLEKTSARFYEGRNIGDIVNFLLLYVFPAAGIILLLMVSYGGFKIMTSGGNPQKVAQGKDILTGSLIGFGIIFVSFWIVEFVAAAFGLGSILP